MNIGLLSTRIADQGREGFYNRQDVGLAKALLGLFATIQVYKTIPYGQEKRVEDLEGYDGISLIFIPTRRIGHNGLIDTTALDKELDVLVYFSDTQLAVPRVYKWAVKNQVLLLPYIGSIESHSTNVVIRQVIDLLFKRNLSIYKSSLCLAKTGALKNRLGQLGVGHVTVAPVGLDLSLVKEDHIKYDITKIKTRYGYRKDDKVLLFIGRLIDEKQPLRMIDIFADIVQKDERYKLLMVGTGNLGEAVTQKIKELGIGDGVKRIDRIPNSDIWELYRIADAFINLNQQEIFGMSILEAMYYGCKVIAWKAPGPEMIIEDGVSGWIVEEDGQIIDRIFDRKEVEKRAHEHILNEFTWRKTAELIARAASEPF